MIRRVEVGRRAHNEAIGAQDLYFDRACFCVVDSDRLFAQRVSLGMAQPGGIVVMGDFLLGGIAYCGRAGDENHTVERVVGGRGDEAFSVIFLDQISAAIERLDLGGEKVSRSVA